MLNNRTAERNATHYNLDLGGYRDRQPVAVHILSISTHWPRSGGILPTIHRAFPSGTAEGTTLPTMTPLHASCPGLWRSRDRGQLSVVQRTFGLQRGTSCMVSTRAADRTERRDTGCVISQRGPEARPATRVDLQLRMAARTPTATFGRAVAAGCVLGAFAIDSTFTYIIVDRRWSTRPIVVRARRRHGRFVARHIECPPRRYSRGWRRRGDLRSSATHLAVARRGVLGPSCRCSRMR
jgi:hypothetical protein